jgi:putative ABC transport system permease protein
LTLTRLVGRNVWRNRRRCLLTILSLSFSFLLLTVMMTVWHSFYTEQWTTKGALRLVCRHRVSLFAAMPSYYREKILAVTGVVNVTPMNQFWGRYRDQKSKNGFLQIGVDPQQFLNVYAEYEITPEQVAAWQQDPAGAIAGVELAQQLGWKLGDRIVVQGVKYPFDLELTLRGIYKTPIPTYAMFFNWNYVEQKIRRGKDDVFLILADSPHDVGRIAAAVDNLFHNAPQPTRTEAEQAFDIDMVSTIGNVKAFLLSICLAVLFATLLVSANTIAMSIRERGREVAVLRALGFPPKVILGLFVGESVVLCVVGWLLASLAALALVYALVHCGGAFAVFLRLRVPTIVWSLLTAGLVGVLSAAFPAYRVSRLNIVEGLRQIG